MSVEITDNSGGILMTRVSGKLTQPELAALQSAAGDILKQQGRTCLLVVAENFEGWESEGDWSDLSFAIERDAEIEKMAIVGEKKWEDSALLFVSRRLRPFPIKYFELADIARARAWLMEPLPQPPSR